SSGWLLDSRGANATDRHPHAGPKVNSAAVQLGSDSVDRLSDFRPHLSFCLTSKMSHDHSRHDSCRLRLYSRWVHSILLSLARGMTAVVVGSGALLGFLSEFDSVKLSASRSQFVSHVDYRLLDLLNQLVP